MRPRSPRDAGVDGEVNQPKQRHRRPDGSDYFRIASLRPFPGRL